MVRMRMVDRVLTGELGQPDFVYELTGGLLA
jgi:hypothetical protein